MITEKKYTTEALIHVLEEHVQQIASRGKKKLINKKYAIKILNNVTTSRFLKVEIEFLLQLIWQNTMLQNKDLPAQQAPFYRGNSSCSLSV